MLRAAAEGPDLILYPEAVAVNSRGQPWKSRPFLSGFAPFISASATHLHHGLLWPTIATHSNDVYLTTREQLTGMTKWIPFLDQCKTEQDRLSFEKLVKGFPIE